jgi:hypothetical protein
MYTNIRTYSSQFNPEVVRDLQKIDKELNEEFDKYSPDKEKILKLRQQQLLRGMELGNGYTNNFTRRFIPW